MIQTGESWRDPGICDVNCIDSGTVQDNFQVGELLERRGAGWQFAILDWWHGLSETSGIEDHDITRFRGLVGRNGGAVVARRHGVLRIQLKQSGSGGGELDRN